MRIAFIIAVLVFGQSLSAKEVKIDLIPKTSHFPAAQVELKPISSIHIDSVGAVAMTTGYFLVNDG